MNAGEAEHGYEITYWKQDDRTIVCLVLNPEIVATQTGGGNSTGLKSRTVKVALVTSGDLRNVLNERTGQPMADGREFNFDWPMNEAVIVPFAGAPPSPSGTLRQ
jgi:hypothetical protein